jgi:hypothetical protein
MPPVLWFLIFAAIGSLFFRRWMLDALVEAVNNFKGGGPRTPMHPSPVNDAALLRKKFRRRIEN